MASGTEDLNLSEACRIDDPSGDEDRFPLQEMDDLCLTLILSRLNQEDVASLSQLLPSMLLRCMRVAGPVLVNSPQILRAYIYLAGSPRRRKEAAYVVKSIQPSSFGVLTLPPLDSFLPTGNLTSIRAQLSRLLTTKGLVPPSFDRLEIPHSVLFTRGAPLSGPILVRHLVLRCTKTAPHAPPAASLRAGFSGVESLTVYGRPGSAHLLVAPFEAVRHLSLMYSDGYSREDSVGHESIPLAIQALRGLASLEVQGNMTGDDCWKALAKSLCRTCPGATLTALRLRRLRTSFVGRSQDAPRLVPFLRSLGRGLPALKELQVDVSDDDMFNSAVFTALTGLTSLWLRSCYAPSGLAAALPPGLASLRLSFLYNRNGATSSALRECADRLGTFQGFTALAVLREELGNASSPPVLFDALGLNRLASLASLTLKWIDCTGGEGGNMSALSILTRLTALTLFDDYTFSARPESKLWNNIPFITLRRLRELCVSFTPNELPGPFTYDNADSFRALRTLRIIVVESGRAAYAPNAAVHGVADFIRESARLKRLREVSFHPRAPYRGIEDVALPSEPSILPSPRAPAAAAGTASSEKRTNATASSRSNQAKGPSPAAVPLQSVDLLYRGVKGIADTEKGDLLRRVRIIRGGFIETC